ncbi:hypothetical protein AB0O68_33980 [Streptomyces sp. NPDC087512]|uniref:hypothetical protein n=1 Tax=Streptomyces sp. NPDC087512 TaxID=3155059 RepID=UPI00342CD5D7
MAAPGSRPTPSSKEPTAAASAGKSSCPPSARAACAASAPAAKNGITPAWHSDRAAYAQCNDTHWTRSDNLPAHVIARIGDLRIVSGFRVLDFWHCDTHALYPCPHGIRRCGKAHATPKHRDVLFDGMARQTAAGTIVPIQFRAGTKVHRYWVTSADRDRLDDLNSADRRLPPEGEAAPASGASRNRPTCQPAAPLTVHTPQSQPSIPALPTQPSVPVLETAPAAPGQYRPHSADGRQRNGTARTELSTLQQAADTSNPMA